MGAIFPVIAPRKVVVKNKGEWNSLRILADWPRLAVWVNDEQVQDVDCEREPELAHRLRSGYIGLSGLSYPIRFRNLRVRALPGRETWDQLYRSPEDFGLWFVSESTKEAPARFLPLGPVIRAEGGGHLATRKQYRDFEIQLYVRGPQEHNGGILIRSAGKGLGGPRYYEIQIHNVEDAHYPTGSLYFFKRATYPRIADNQWFFMQIRAQGPRVLVRIEGDTVLEYDRLGEYRGRPHRVAGAPPGELARVQEDPRERAVRQEWSCCERSEPFEGSAQAGSPLYTHVRHLRVCNLLSVRTRLLRWKALARGSDTRLGVASYDSYSDRARAVARRLPSPIRAARERLSAKQAGSNRKQVACPTGILRSV